MAYVRIVDTFARFHVDVEPVGTDDVPVFVVCDVEIGDVVRVFGSGQSYFGDELLVRYDGLVRVGVVRVRVVGTFGTFLDDGNGCRVSACGERDFGCASIVAVVCREGRDGDCVASAVAGVGSDGEPVALYACGPRGGRGERDGFLKPTVKLEVQLLHRLPPSLERSGKGGGRRWKPGIRVIRQYKIKKGDLCLPRINYFCIVYEV